MKDKYLEMLEFPRIKEILAGYTAFGYSREMALALRPSTDASRVNAMLKQSAEARHLLSLEPDLSIGGVYDVREAVILASRGKILEVQALLDIQRTLTAIRYFHNKLGRLSEEAPLLAAINSRIEHLPHLESAIGRCISPAAEPWIQLQINWLSCVVFEKRPRFSLVWTL